MLAYLNCPLCHLSIEQRRGRPALTECPRCHAQGRAVPLFKSRLQWLDLAAADDPVVRPDVATAGAEA
jgi:hypothetical protein